MYSVVVVKQSSVHTFPMHILGQFYQILLIHIFFVEGITIVESIQGGHSWFLSHMPYVSTPLPFGCLVPVCHA